jgi:hypothetical protein
MTPDSDTKIQTKRDKTDPLSRYVAYVSDVLLALGVRRIIQIDDGGNWFVLGCRYHFLLYFRMFLVVLFYIFKTNT